MELIRGLAQLRARHRGCVATIGNFDGVHIGHQVILQQLAHKATALQLPSVVILFEPQPQEFFQPHQAPVRLTRLREKLVALQHYPIERVLRVRFNQAFATLSADGFIQTVLVNGLSVQHLIVGDDFRFGRGRQGHFAHLEQAGQTHGFTLEHQQTVVFQGERVSSTRIRDLLAQGDLLAAQQLLGRAYSLSGRVIYGKQLGRTIGFPTLNIDLQRPKPPINGVFAVKVHGIADKPRDGVTNIGKRPTVGGQHFLLETHVFDWSGNGYGKYITVELIQRIREEKTFHSLSALKEQIQHDSYIARQILAGTG